MRTRLLFLGVLSGALLSGVLHAAAPSQARQSREEALFEAAREGNLEEVRVLLGAGVSPHVENRYKATPLFFAANRGHLDVVRLLVEHGARVDVRDTFYQMSALSRALLNQHRGVVLYLLEHGAPGAGEVLVSAARSDDAEMAKAALDSEHLDLESYQRARDTADTENATSVIELLSTTTPPQSATSGPVELTPEQLDRFVGRYQNDARNVVYEVERRQTRLYLRTSASDAPVELRPKTEISFDMVGRSQEVSFPGRGGMVERMVVGDKATTLSLRPIDEAESREAAPVRSADSTSSEERSSDLERVTRSSPSPWPQFRGPNGSGVADGQGVPLEWDATTGKGVKWKMPIPGFSVSSPIIWGDRVFVLTAVSGAGDETFRTGLYGDVRPVDDLSEHRWVLYGLDLSSGRVLWDTEIHRGTPGTKRHTKSSQANSTPVTDGKRIVTVLGAVGLLVCHDVDGNLLWSKDIGVLNAGWFYDPDYQWGHSSSPILYGSSVILQVDVHNESFLAAFDIETGDELWRTPRGEEIPTFSSPTVYRGETGDELVTNGTRIRGYDPESGELLWHLGPNSEIPIGVPVVTEDLIFVTAGYPPVRPIYAVRPGSRGDLAQPEGIDKSEAIAWSKDRGGTYIPSPLVYRGHFYTNANNGRLTCYDARTGERIYRARIGGVGGSYAASPIVADGRLYFTNEDGETFVIKAGPEYELLAKNTVDGVVLSSPAASNGVLVIRTLNEIYGLAE
jgi:outer membrane protein assembly factor BamB